MIQNINLLSILFFLSLPWQSCHTSAQITIPVTSLDPNNFMIGVTMYNLDEDKGIDISDIDEMLSLETSNKNPLLKVQNIGFHSVILTQNQFIKLDSLVLTPKKETQTIGSGRTPSDVVEFIIEQTPGKKNSSSKKSQTDSEELRKSLVEKLMADVRTCFQNFEHLSIVNFSIDPDGTLLTFNIGFFESLYQINIDDNLKALHKKVFEKARNYGSLYVKPTARGRAITVNYSFPLNEK